MPDASKNEKLDEILAEYVTAEEAGEPVSRDGLLKQHPELADELKEFFADRDQFKRLASPLSPEAARRNDLPARVRYFGDYELLEEIAQGGMGVVYKARQTSLNRIVAVKMVLAGHLATDADVQRFADEAETAASLKHKAIVPIHEVGQQNGQHYFSMDFIEGRNLAEVIRTDPPSLETAALIVKAIAEAVDYAHSEGIIHRDIKPSNILIDESGQVHITDFGLALRVEGDSDLTRTGQVLGTPSYMPPEQALAKRDLVGPASDIYALGAILYELLTGRPPFRGETAADTIRQLIDTEPLSPRKLNHSAPRDLETICLKCLEKEPHKRYGTAGLLADDLGRYLAGEPILARPVGRVERLVRWGRREPAVASLTVALALLLVIGTCVSSYFAIEANKRAQAESEQRVLAERRLIEANDARDAEAEARKLAERREYEANQAKNAEAKASYRAEDRRREAVEARKLANQRLKESHWQVYLLRLQSMQQLWKSKEFGHLDRMLRESTPVDDALDFRGWEWYYLQDQVDTMSRRICGDHNFEGFFCFHANRRRLLSERNGRWEYWDVAENRLLDSFQLKMCRPETVQLSPDGQKVAWGTWNCHMLILDIGSRQLHDIDAHPEDDADQIWMADVAWSPDGQQLASMSRAGGIKIWDVTTGELVRQLKRGNAQADIGGQLAWHKVSGLASGHRYGTVRVWDVHSAEVIWTATIGGKPVQTLHWSPSGSKLAFGTIGIAVHDTEGKRIGMVAGLSNETTWAWLDDERFVVAGADQDLRLGDCSTFQLGMPIHVHSHRVSTLAKFDDEHILSGSVNGSLRIVSIRSLFPPHDRIKAFDGPVRRVVWSPSGTCVAATGQGKSAKVWNANSLEPLWSLSNEDGIAPRDIAWRHTDNTIATIHQNGRLLFWDGTTGMKVGTALAPEAGKIALSPVDSRIVVSDARTHVLATPSGESIWSDKERNNGLRSAFDPSGRFLCAETKSGVVWLFDAATGRKLYRDRAARKSAGRGTGVTWSPRGNLFAVGSDTIRVYSTHGRKLVHELVGHRGAVRDVAFDPTGTRLASVGADDQLIIWDAATGASVIQLETDSSQGINSLGWSPDGRRLAVGASDGTLLIWGSGKIKSVSTEIATPGTGILEQVASPIDELAELTERIESQAADPNDFKKRARLLMQLQEWERASRDWDAFLTERGEHMFGRAEAALTCAMNGDEKKYRSHCERLFNYSDDWEPGTVVVCGVAFSLRPNPPETLNGVLRRVEENAKSKPGDWHKEFPRFGLLYRLGRYQEVLDIAVDWESRHDGHYYRVHRLLWSAMACQKLEQFAAARINLSLAIKLLESELPRPGDWLPETGMPQWIECQLIRSEAAALIQARPSNAKDDRAGREDHKEN